MKKKNINSADTLTLPKKGARTFNKLYFKKASPLTEVEVLKLLQELEVHQIELQMQNEELREANSIAQLANEKFSALYNYAPTGYFTLEPYGSISELNFSGAWMLGKEREVLVNSNFRFFVSHENLPDFNHFLTRVFETGTKQTCEVMLTQSDNTSFFVYIEGIRKEDENKCLLSVIDNTRRKQAEEALIESELHFRTLADSGKALIRTAGIDKKCNYFNQPWLTFTGQSLEHELGNGWAVGVHPDDLQKCFDTYVRAFDHREKFSMEYRIRHASGEYRWIQDEGSPRYNSGGEFIGYIGQCLDIHDRKLLEFELINAKEKAETNEQMYRLLVDAIPYTSIHLFDRNLRYMISGGGEIEKNQFNKSEMDGKTLREAYPKDVADLFEPIYKKALLGEPTIFEMHYGSFIYEQQTIPVRDATGDTIGGLQVATNITERRKAEESLLKVHEQLVLAQHSAGTGFWDWDMVTDKLDWSPELFYIFGLNSSSEVASFGTWLRIMHPDDKEIAGKMLNEAIRDHIPLENEYRIILPDGDYRWISALGNATYDDDGAPIRMTGICFNITARKKAEELLKEKMKEMEKFNQIMIGRENRMIELKQEINELCLILNQPERYSAPRKINENILSS